MVNFKHDYDKLKMPVFPTIRSKGYSDKHGFKCGDTVAITSPSLMGPAIYIDYQDKKIKDIPLCFLQFDASPLPIRSHQDFVDTLNSFLPKGWGHNQLSTVKRIHWFKWTKITEGG